ncbi:integrase core domain protein [Trichonephila inaurata madagascariensis]|uniref:Integrase core domain protein n=1 Tax=Trichonephila inaurata madagascariensis TaxID=2747483 RepID=A0A8X6Y1C8_9ARAC|nr:integrase core domain protein [Trichonephila inaurata madagascariensis]
MQTCPCLKDCRLHKSLKPKTLISIGALMYLMVGTRPDLAYGVGFLSTSLENPSAEDIVRVKRVFRYIAGTVGYGITYCATETKGVLHCYSDSDFGGCTKTSRSTSGYVMIYLGGAISGCRQRQAIVATSTTEAEVIAASEAAKEIIWLCRLIQGIVNLGEIPTLQEGNSKVVTQP